MEHQAIKLATKWRESSKKYLDYSTKKQMKQMNLLFQNEHDKETLIRIIDRCFRSSNTKVVLDFLVETFKVRGVPKFFAWWEKLGIYKIILFGKFFHKIYVPIFKAYTMHSVSNYVVFGGLDKVGKKIRNNAKYKIQTNVNHLGELLLGEKEAMDRVDGYIKDLENKDIKCISIKISTICSQILSIAFDQTVAVLKERLIPILRAAKNNKYQDESGVWHYKLVNFDMEEYRDMPLTVVLFMQTLSELEFKDLMVGIALQAYLPDSFEAQKTIVEWAKIRVQNGGSPVRIRIVKGANMESEVFESYERNFPLATYNGKYITDSNHKRMIMFGLQPENAAVVNVGVASHNLFDIAFAYLQAEKNGTLAFCRFEMLQGMCDHVMKYLANDVGLSVLTYLPFSGKNEFVSSIGYLVRRFDENTSKDNYLRYINNLADENGVWKTLQEKFILSIDNIKNLDNIKTYRLQNRLIDSYENGNFNVFKEEVDTDFTIKNNVEWILQIKEKWQNGNGYEAKLPALATIENIDEILIKNKTKWQEMTDEQRFAVLGKVAQKLREKRGDLIGLAAFNTGKIFSEADSEVTEAIDFCEYYVYSFAKFKQEFIDKLNISAKGTGLIISPWNFPIAIPAGGILSALATGNNVIFKPSNLSTLVGFMLCECMWDAGVPREALQFVNSVGDVSKYLAAHKNIDFITFTGGTQTALDIIKNNPSVYMAAETGGKNVTVATQYCDRDQVIKNVLHSAFSNSGQKCSATSILALQTEIYNDDKFLSGLVDAAKSLKVGEPWDLSVKVGPLVREPTGDLLWALTELDEDESWLLKPVKINEKTWTPGIKIGTKFGNKSHFTEFFGPVLSIMQFSHIDDAIKLVNASGYGLTSGLESLDEREQENWKNRIKAGNLYINRTTTGALVMRQPFGGMGKSSFGCGIKAGGLNYVTQFINCEPIANIDIVCSDIMDIKLPEIIFINSIKNEQFACVAKNYIRSYADYFNQEIDYANVLGQYNICRFVKTSKMAIRVQKGDDELSILARLLAAKLCVKNVTVSSDDEMAATVYTIKNNNNLAFLFDGVKTIIENDESFAKSIINYKRIRYSGDNVPQIVTEAAAEFGIYISKTKFVCEGRIELLQYLQEQSISCNYHRYGHVSLQMKIIK